LRRGVDAPQKNKKKNKKKNKLEQIGTNAKTMVQQRKQKPHRTVTPEGCRRSCRGASLMTSGKNRKRKGLTKRPPEKETGVGLGTSDQYQNAGLQKTGTAPGRGGVTKKKNVQQETLEPIMTFID